MPATTTTDLQLPSRNLSSSSGVDHIHLTSPSRHSTHSPDHTCPSSMLPSSLKPQATKLWPLALGTCWPVGLSHLRVWVGFVYRSSCLTSPHLWRSDHLGGLEGFETTTTFDFRLSTAIAVRRRRAFDTIQGRSCSGPALASYLLSYHPSKRTEPEPDHAPETPRGL